MAYMDLFELIDRLRKLSVRAKVATVVGGYLIAVLVAFGVVALHAALAPTNDDTASSGMHAFGDALLFLLTLAVASVPPTAATVVFLWPRRAG